MPKQVYQIDPNTREFVGFATAYENPMSKIDGIPFNIPNSCVEDEPPPHKEGFARVREGNVWTYVIDNRGKVVYSTTDKTQKTVSELGVIPEGFTFLIPGRFSKWSKTKWIDDTDALKAAAKEENNANVKATLQDMDDRSIRSLREWIASQPNAPQFLKDYEKAAQVERAKLQK